MSCCVTSNKDFERVRVLLVVVSGANALAFVSDLTLTRKAADASVAVCFEEIRLESLSLFTLVATVAKFAPGHVAPRFRRCVWIGVCACIRV